MSDNKLHYMEQPSIITEKSTIDQNGNSEREQKISYILNDISEMINGVKSLRGSTAKMIDFSCTGLTLPAPDVDILIQVQEVWSPIAYFDAVNYLNDNGKFHLFINIRNEKVAVITVMHCATEISCDLTFASATLKLNNVLQNTEMLKKYAEYGRDLKANVKDVISIFSKMTLFRGRNLDYLTPSLHFYVGEGMRLGLE